MKWMSLILSFFIKKLNRIRTPNLKDAALALLEEAAYRSRKPVSLLLGGLACILILCGGLFMSLIDLANQLDREGSFRLSANFTSGLVLVIMTLGVFLWIFTMAWPGVRKNRVFEKKALPPPKPSPLEQALSLLVMDFVKERELKREHREYREPSHEKEPSPLYNN